MDVDDLCHDRLWMILCYYRLWMILCHGRLLLFCVNYLLFHHDLWTAMMVCVWPADDSLCHVRCCPAADSRSVCRYAARAPAGCYAARRVLSAVAREERAPWRGWSHCLSGRWRCVNFCLLSETFADLL